MGEQQQPGPLRAAGVALDIEICRRVFGHDIKPEWESWLPAIPPYSTSIADAWLVVDEFARRRIPVSLYSMSHGVWFCFFGSPPILEPANPMKPTHEVRADTPAEAICRAALAAAGHEQAGDE